MSIERLLAFLAQHDLDYERVGTLELTGKGDRYTLKAPSAAPLTIGARRRDGKNVDRGFEGLLDEVRLSARPLEPNEFLRVREIEPERPVRTRLRERTLVDANGRVAVHRPVSGGAPCPSTGQEPARMVCHSFAAK